MTLITDERARNWSPVQRRVVEAMAEALINSRLAGRSSYCEHVDSGVPVGEIFWTAAAPARLRCGPCTDAALAVRHDRCDACHKVRAVQILECNDGSVPDLPGNPELTIHLRLCAACANGDSEK